MSVVNVGVLLVGGGGGGGGGERIIDTQWAFSKSHYAN